MSRHLLRDLLAVTIVGAASLTLTAAPADAGGGRGGGRDGCPVPEMCTVRPTVEFFGTFATFEFTTHPSIKQVEVIVWEKGTSKGGGTGYDAGQAPASWDPIMVAGLRPDTAYDWTFIATDATGATYTTTDSAVTLTRRVVVSFDHIYVDDDSDDGGAGELSATFLARNKPWSPVWDAGDVDSGDTIWPGTVITLDNVPDDEIWAFASVHDDDEEAWDGCPPIDWAGAVGTNSCEDFGTIAGLLSLTSPKPGMENFTTTETFNPEYPAWMANDLWFTVNVTWTVTYV